MNIPRIFNPVFFLALTFLFAFSGAARGQYCIGYTEYQVRLPEGKPLTSKHLFRLGFESFDGKRREFKMQQGGADVFYTLDGKNRLHRIETKDQISVIFGPCGQIGEMTLVYKDLRMKLLFNIGINNTNFLIRSLPFQPGTFVLRSLKCIDSKPPPLVDNETFGYCEIPSESWEKVGDSEDDRPGAPDTGTPLQRRRMI